jgi:uncharacterized YigZ family protein
MQMPTDTFKTISGESQGLYKDKGSRFLAFAWPVNSETEVKEKLNDIKQRYHDARHHCYAYQIGLQGEKSRSNDDGEPSGTAGKPISRQIQSHGFTNILVVVVRYFGGILLGTSGLIEAYKSAAQQALEHASPIEKTVEIQYNIGFDYMHMNTIMNILKLEEAAVVQRNFGEKAELLISIRLSKSKNLEERLKQLPGCIISHVNQ